MASLSTKIPTNKKKSAKGIQIIPIIIKGFNTNHVASNVYMLKSLILCLTLIMVDSLHKVILMVRLTSKHLKKLLHHIREH